jgi:hypothetical protein
MKSRLALSMMFVLASALLASSAHAQTYTVKRITNDDYQDSEPRINSSGTIVWTSRVGPDWCLHDCLEVMMYKDSQILRLTDDDRQDWKPRINDNDFVVWNVHDGADWDVLLYDGSSTVPISEGDASSNDVDPQIDNDNHVTWRRYFGYDACSANDILRYDGVSTTRISHDDTCKSSPEVSSAGYAVWMSEECSPFAAACELYPPHELYLYDGLSTSLLTSSQDERVVNPHVNDSGSVAWNSDQEIYVLDDGSLPLRLTENDLAESRPRINVNGHVVWQSAWPYDTYWYDGTDTVRLTDSPESSLGARNPVINARNTAVWQGALGDCYRDWDEMEILVHDGSNTIRLTDDCQADTSPQINDDGWIVWAKAGEIYLAVPDQAASVEIGVPRPQQVLQDGVTLTARTTGIPGASEVYFYVREADGDAGVPIGHEDLPATPGSTTGEYEHAFDSTVLPDGHYIVFARVVDSIGNEVVSDAVPFSVRNWATVELLPSSNRFQPGRTVSVKFSVRLMESVDEVPSFIYNENLLVRIYDSRDPLDALQESVYGDASKDYRIDSVAEHYVTNFKTATAPAEYTVEVWRPDQSFLIARFSFETVGK